MLNIFKLEEYISKNKTNALYPLYSSSAESFSLQEILDISDSADRNFFYSTSLEYVDSEKEESLQETISAFLYNNEIDPNNILCFSGGEDAIFCTLFALCEPHCQIIVMTPCYQSLMEIPKIKNSIVKTIALNEKDNWGIDINKIEKTINKYTKAVIINSPHNPTGQIIKTEDLQKLIKILKERDVWLFSNEIYSFIGGKIEKSATLLYEKAISINGMSKSFGLPGIRIGWILCRDKKLLSKIRTVRSYTSVCNSQLSEIVAKIAIKKKNVILKRNNDIIIKNLNLVDCFLKNNKNLFSWVQPMGGCVGFVRYSGEQVDMFCKKLLYNAGVLTIPASVYNINSNHLRIGFGKKSTERSLCKMDEWLKSCYNDIA